MKSIQNHLTRRYHLDNAGANNYKVQVLPLTNPEVYDMKRIVFALCFALVASSLAAGGCHWMGRTAGKTKAKIERKTDSVEDGYHEGYQREKAKTSKKK